MQVNDNIKLIRELSGEKQAEFAQRIGTKLSNLKTYENTDVKPKAAVLAAIADFAGIPIEDLKVARLTHKDIKIKSKKDKKVRTGYSDQEPPSSLVEENMAAYGDSPENRDTTLYKLASSNERLSRSHEKLVNILERRFTENDAQRRLEDAEASIRGLQVFVSELDSQVKKRPFRESWEALGIKVEQAMEELGKKNNSVDANN